VPSRYGDRLAYGHVFINCDVVVSGGLGCSILPFRFGVPPEIVLVTVGAAPALSRVRLRYGRICAIAQGNRGLQVTNPILDGEIRDGRHHMQVRVYDEGEDAHAWISPLTNAFRWAFQPDCRGRNRSLAGRLAILHEGASRVRQEGGRQPRHSAGTLCAGHLTAVKTLHLGPLGHPKLRFKIAPVPGLTADDLSPQNYRENNSGSQHSIANGQGSGVADAGCPELKPRVHVSSIPRNNPLEAKLP
jgi:hypothetical protein